ncbi:MAG: hypothetical protein BWY76_00716 [bacterium ADurb.Bin429]|nr:MAG: hypothetical protein BWY76_00716 [bacterium ADurb.Bin429]
MISLAAAIAFFLDNWKTLLAALLLALVALFFSLWRHETKAFNAFKIEVAAKAKAQDEKTAAINKIQNLTTLETEANYEQGITAILDLYGPGRLQHRAGGSKLPGISSSAKKPDAAAADTRSGATLPATIENDQCQGLKSDAAATTRQLLYLQNWIERQSSVPR